LPFASVSQPNTKVNQHQREANSLAGPPEAWVAGTLVQRQNAKDEVCKTRHQQGIQKSSLVEEESDMKRNEFEALALL